MLVVMVMLVMVMVMVVMVVLMLVVMVLAEGPRSLVCGSSNDSVAQHRTAARSAVTLTTYYGLQAEVHTGHLQVVSVKHSPQRAGGGPPASLLERGVERRQDENLRCLHGRPDLSKHADC